VLHTLGVHACNYLSHNKVSYLLLEDTKKLVGNRTVQEEAKFYEANHERLCTCL